MMKKYFPVIFAILLVFIIAAAVVYKKNTKQKKSIASQDNNIGLFVKAGNCANIPQFLKYLKVGQHALIDLSQKRFKGVAILTGRKFDKSIHPRQWEQFGPMGTYTLDPMGNIYLVPTPYVSIKPTTFNLQKNLYILDSKTGKISIFMHFDDIHPTSNNPYGLSTIDYDCDDGSVWLASIDKSDYNAQKGTIFHINPKTKERLQEIKGFDLLTMKIVKSDKGKYLLAGSARDNGLYAFAIVNQSISTKPIKLLELPDANEHIRKIKVIDNNTLQLQAIPFSYSLIAQSAKKDRTIYKAVYDPNTKKWTVSKN